MDAYDGLIATLALSMGASWASGINLYAVLLVLGFGGATGNIDLPPNLDVLANPLVIAAAAFMYAVEFFADKIPGVDSGWDALHTFIRIPAGALLAAGAVGDVSPVLTMAAVIIGGGLASTSHATKAGTRLLINTSPEPVTNWSASLVEDALVIGGLWAALNHPALFLVFLCMMLTLSIWLLPKLWRLLKTLFQKITAFFGDNSKYDSEQKSVLYPEIAFGGGGAKNTIDELERLKALRDSGAITEEEYSLAKKRLLGE
ncbi:MAG: DUF4126 family protein [Marinagarivorans sp.]|nr:DUF4126 family protein [Marinagarivorans sp.]